MPGKHILAIAILAILLLAVTPATAASSSEPGVHITKMIIEPDGPNLNITVHYSTSFMTKFFSMLFGAKVVQPAIVDQLSAFGDVKMVSIDTSAQTAKFVAKDQGRLSNGMYVYDRNVTFPVPIDRLEINGSTVDRPIMQNNSDTIPTFFYRP